MGCEGRRTRDLYIHELIAQMMVARFEGRRPASPAYLKFQVSTEIVNRIRAAATPSDASAAFDLYVRSYLSRITYQAPEDIADGVRLCCAIELWNEVALKLGATPATKVDKAKSLKRRLSLVVRRRNTIAHEGDRHPEIRGRSTARILHWWRTWLSASCMQSMM